MAFIGSGNTLNVQLNAVAALCNSGFIQIYSGTRPATPDTALSGNTLLATLAFGATAFAAASSGVATANAITSGTAVANGTASFARLLKANGVTVVGDCNCGTSGSDLNLSTLSVVSGQAVACSLMTLFFLQNTIVLDGNSFTSSAGFALPIDVGAALETFGPYFNNSQPGAPTPTLTANAPTATDPHFGFYKGPGNVVVLVEITNDIYNGASAATAYSDVVTYCQARQAVGWKVVVCTCLSRSGGTTPGNFNTTRATVNANIRANFLTFANAVADWASDPNMGIDGAETNTTYFSGDLTHPNATGMAVLATYVVAAVQSLGYQ